MWPRVVQGGLRQLTRVTQQGRSGWFHMAWGCTVWLGMAQVSLGWLIGAAWGGSVWLRATQCSLVGGQLREDEGASAGWLRLF